MRLSLSTWVLIGFLAGIAAGLLAGEYCAPLGVLGDVYVGLLQMTVLPYIIISLVVNLGRLTVSTCRRLAGAVCGVLVVLWLMVALVVMALPSALPEWQSGNFFTVGLLEKPPQLDLLQLFIPTNPFKALAENTVPAAVLFSICVGIGLIGVGNKGALLDGLQALLRAFSRINHFVALFSPLGVFAIMAKTAGTIDIEQFTRLQAYLLIYAVGVLLLVLLILPLLVTLATSIGYRAFLREAWGPMLTAFATGKIFVVLPLIAEGSERLLRESGTDAHAAAEPEALVSLGYPFPHLGKLIALLFVPFAAWFVGSSLAWSDYPSFLGAGLVSMFGSPLASIPFLLDLERLPADMFQLFVASGVVCGRLGDMLGVVHLMAFTILTTCLLQRTVRVRVRGLILGGTAAVAVLLVSIVAMRFVLVPVVRDLPAKDQVVLSMHTAVVSAPTREWASPPPTDTIDQKATRLQRIHQRGALRVGCLADNLPFSFRNESGQLVGLDIDMAHLLAAELGCELWLVPLAPEQVLAELERGSIDLVMSGLVPTTDWLGSATFSHPYMHVTMALIVRDHRRREFANLADIQRIVPLRIATPTSRYFSDALAERWPQAELVSIQSPREYFEKPALVRMRF